jgi:hypothetical protein
MQFDARQVSDLPKSVPWFKPSLTARESGKRQDIGFGFKIVYRTAALPQKSA